MTTTHQVFRGWTRLTLRSPVVLLSLVVLSVVVSLLITSRRLSFSTDRTQLLDPQHPIQRSYRAFRSEFGGNTDLVVLVTGAPQDVRDCADELARQLLQDKNIFEDVLYRLDLPEVAQHALYFLSYKDLERLQKQLQAIRPWLPAVEHGLPGLLTSLANMPENQARERLQPILPVFSKVLEGVISTLHSRGSAPYQSPLPAFQPESKLLQGKAFKPGQSVFYNTVGGERTCMLIAQPRDRSGSFEADSTTVARLRATVNQVLRSYPRVNCLVSGEPVINTDEMVGARDDAVSSGLTALVLVCLLLTITFGDAIRPACAVISLLVGLSWSFAFASLTVGTLNLLTVHFATILVGLSMTFAIQLLSHYQELRSRAPAGSQVVEDTVAETGPQSLIGAVTTAVAFWSLHFTNFRAAGELGLITGTGVLLTFLSILTIFPALLHLVDNYRPTRPLRIPGFALLGEKLQERPWWVLGVSLVITLYSLTWINRVPFNYNVLSLQARGSDSVRVEKYLQGMGYSTLYAVTTAPSVEQAGLLAGRFEALSTVSHVETVAGLLPHDEERKGKIIEKILEIGRELKTLPRPEGSLPAGEFSRNATQLLELNERFLAAANHLDHLLALLPASPDRDKVMSQLSQMRILLDPKLPGPLEEGLRDYEGRLTEDLEIQGHFLREQKTGPPQMLRSLPEALRARSISPAGNVCLRIFPRGDCWEREPLERFVKQLEKADPKVTGSPLLIYYYLEELRQAYSSAGRNALLVICVLLLLHFRSFAQAGLALFPKLLGVVWMIGAMGVAEVSFNAANFLALPITLGIGLIFGVNILLECRSGGVAGLLGSSTGAAVLLSGLTATIGFSSFLLASHRGVASFGFVMAAGVGANLLTSLFTLPALLTAWQRFGRDRGAVSI